MNFEDLNQPFEIKRLGVLLPTVKKVHGSEHPELIEIHDNYFEFLSRLENKEVSIEEIQRFSNKMVSLSNNFSVPKDGCQAYIETFELLSKLDYELKKFIEKE